MTDRVPCARCHAYPCICWVEEVRPTPGTDAHTALCRSLTVERFQLSPRHDHNYPTTKDQR